MKNYIIKNKRDCTKGLTELEFSIMRGEVAQQMYSGINNIDCDDCQSADEMCWRIFDIEKECVEETNYTYYTVHGVVVHEMKSSFEEDIAEYWVEFTEENGIVGTMVVPYDR
jgi:hypothetical protein